MFIEKLKSLPFVKEIWLFGSHSRNDNKKRADLDLAIISPNITDQECLGVMDIIENADTLLKIDCVRFDSSKISLELYENILKGYVAKINIKLEKFRKAFMTLETISKV